MYDIVNKSQASEVGEDWSTVSTLSPVHDITSGKLFNLSEPL